MDAAYIDSIRGKGNAIFRNDYDKEEIVLFGLNI